MRAVLPLALVVMAEQVVMEQLVAMEREAMMARQVTPAAPEVLVAQVALDPWEQPAKMLPQGAMAHVVKMEPMERMEPTAKRVHVG